MVGQGLEDGVSAILTIENCGCAWRQKKAHTAHLATLLSLLPAFHTTSLHTLQHTALFQPIETPLQLRLAPSRQLQESHVISASDHCKQPALCREPSNP